MKLKIVLFLFLLSCFLASCEPNKNTSAVYQNESRYRQDFVSPVALFIRERNGEPFITASAFLIDKQRGLFASAKHFVGNESDGNCKIFFNGKVYKGFLVKVPAVTDIVIIKIDGSFNSKVFSEPYGFAKGVNKGDKVFIKGIHPHEKKFQQDKNFIPIFQEYYGIIGKSNEFVFDDLSAEVVNIARKIVNKEIKDSSETLGDFSNVYIALRTNEDHQLSFGVSFSGLSGGPTINEKNELIGINAVEDSAYIEINPKEIVYHPLVNLNLVPVIELQKLMLQLDNIK